MFSSKTRWFPVIGLVIHSKNLSLSFANPRLKNHYDALGITPHATQTDIKAAYYKLSKKYHPDINKGSEEASEKFRDISAAYEVLGNFRLRKLYDKGILHTAGPQFTDHEQPIVEDDATTKFYKSRMQRSKPPTPTGRTPIYDFDEWSRAHYGVAFARKEAARAKFDKRESNLISDKNDIQKELLIFGITFCVLLSAALHYTNLENHDTVQEVSQETDRPTGSKNSGDLGKPGSSPA